MKRILIIETDPILRGIYRRKFEMTGYQVEAVDDGNKALSRLQTFDPELVLMDIMLPGAEGAQVIRKIRAQPEFKNVPIIVLSSFYRPDLAKQAWQAGATKCVSKMDCTPNLAVEIVEQIFSGEGNQLHVPIPPKRLPLRSALPPEPEPEHHEVILPEATPSFSSPASKSPEDHTPLPFAKTHPLSPTTTPPFPAQPPGGQTEFRRKTPSEGTIPFPQPPVTPPTPPAQTSPATPGTLPPFPETGIIDNAPAVLDPQEHTSQWKASSPTAFHVEVRHEFFRRMPETQAALRDRISALAKSKNPEEQLALLEPLSVSLASLTNLAGVTGYTRIAHLSGALETLARDLQKKPKQITSSVLRTIAHANDCLNELIKDARQGPQTVPQSTLILVVDDEPISRKTLSLALAKTNLRCLCLEDSRMALKILEENPFDLIFLDAEMPGLNGFELCTELRKLPTNSTSPVIFVTSLTHFEVRARSSLSGGNDLIAKPFLMMELAVKALTYLLKSRSATDTRNAPAVPAA
jgi:CheY-like chemotaxis protein